MRMTANIIEWAKGNPGAMTFLMELNQEDPEVIESILKKLLENPSIRGTQLYVLWSDLCEKDLNKVKILCEKCPDAVLIDACSRQDYSGRELVNDYLI